MPSLIRDRHPADTRLSLDLPRIVPLDHAVAHMATAIALLGRCSAVCAFGCLLSAA